MELFVTKRATPIGEVVAWRTERGLVAMGFADGVPAIDRVPGRHIGGGTEAHDEAPAIGNAIDDYFAGKLDALDQPKVDPHGSALQVRIWKALRRVPPGETTTYGELAATIGTSARVVGNAMAANPVCLALPCHRVIRSDGSWDGYAYGNDRKRWLLEHERVA